MGSNNGIRTVEVGMDRWLCGALGSGGKGWERGKGACGV